MNTIKLQVELSEEELKNFLSSTKEYRVEVIGDQKFKIHYSGGLNGPMDTIIYKPTIQTLLRQLQSMHYLEGYVQKEAELKK